MLAVVMLAVVLAVLPQSGVTCGGFLFSYLFMVVCGDVLGSLCF